MPWLSTALDLIGDVLSLRAGFALAAAEVAGVGRIAVAVAILAGLSEAVGESVVLFVNRVKPAHFVRSLLISALIFAITYLFLAASIWAVATFVLGADGSFGSIAAVVALAQAPRLFGFLAFLPYFGLPISVLLWVWSLLATTSGVAALLLSRCLAQACNAGFKRAELVATLTGERLYARAGFRTVERLEAILPSGHAFPVVRMTREFR